MTGVLRPVGPQPARVYWVRRAVVLGALLLVLVVVAIAVGASRGDAAGADGGGSGEDGSAVVAAGDEAAGDESDGSDDGAAEGSTDDEAGDSDVVGPATCDATALQVTLTAEGRSFAAPSAPTFAFAVTNTGEVPCTVDAGSSNQVVTVTSGADRIWSSADCADDAEERLLLLQPGAQDVVPLAWDRSRSDAACSADLPAPGAGTYQAVGTMLGATSAPFVFELK